MFAKSQDHIVSDETLWWVFLAAATVVYVTWIYSNGRRRKSIKMNGPKRWPLIGSAIEITKNFHRQHDWLISYSERFSTFEVYLFSIRIIYTVDPRNVEHMLKTNFNNYIKGYISYDVLTDLLGEGIFNSDGERWRQQRKTVSLEFASKNLRDHSAQAFRALSVKFADILAEAAKGNKVVDMNDLFMRIAFDAICQVGFGVEVGALSPSLADLPFATAFDRSNSVCASRYFDLSWKLKRLLNIGTEAQLKEDIVLIDNFTYSLIRKRRADMKKAAEAGLKETKSDILSRFITLSEEDPSQFTDKKLRDVILNIMIAGRDSSAATMSWFFYLLSQHPEVKDRILQEQEEQGMGNLKHEGKCEGEVCRNCVQEFVNGLTYEALSKLHYLHAVLTEVIRLYPAVPVDGKMAVSPDVLPDGTRVRPGDVVNFIPYAMGRSCGLWGKQAHSFDPMRWLQPDGVFRPESPFKFTAFQAGPRICVGKDSAYLQMKIVSSMLLRFFKFELIPNQSIRYMMALTLLMSKDGMMMRVSPRSNKVH